MLMLWSTGSSTLSTGASILVAIPMFVMILLGQLHLDSLLGAPQKREEQRPVQLGTDPDGNQIQTEIWQGTILVNSHTERIRHAENRAASEDTAE